MIGISAEIQIFFCAWLSGMTVLFAGECTASVRRLLQNHPVLAGAGDILYWVGVSIYLFYQMYRSTYGNIRWFFVLGAVCGALSGYLMSRFIKKELESLQKTLQKYQKTDKI